MTDNDRTGFSLGAARDKARHIIRDMLRAHTEVIVKSDGGDRKELHLAITEGFAEAARLRLEEAGLLVKEKPSMGDRLYMVGDFGPELFIPASLMSGDAEE